MRNSISIKGRGIIVLCLWEVNLLSNKYKCIIFIGKSSKLDCSSPSLLSICMYKHILYRFFISECTCIPYMCILLHSLIQEVQGNPNFWPLKSVSDSRYLNHLRSYYLCVHLSGQKEMLRHSSHRISEGLRLGGASGGHLIQCPNAKGTWSFQLGIFMCLLTCRVNSGKLKDFMLLLLVCWL